jgi:hypothetical protein
VNGQQTFPNLTFQTTTLKEPEICSKSSLKLSREIRIVSDNEQTFKQSYISHKKQTYGGFPLDLRKSSIIAMFLLVIVIVPPLKHPHHNSTKSNLGA